MNHTRVFVKVVLSLTSLILALTFFGCSHERAYQKQRDACQKSSDAGERNRCLQKAEEAEKEYQREKNETIIEKNYKRKLEQMRPG